MNIYDVLDKLSISYEEITHDAVKTVKEAKEIENMIDGVPVKNLFLTDNENSYYLVMLEARKRADLKKITRLVNKKHLSFASVNDLKDILKLDSGSVTPLGIINDRDNKVKIVIDKDLVKKKILVHPNVNIKTISINFDVLIMFIKYENHDYILM